MPKLDGKLCLCDSDKTDRAQACAGAKHNRASRCLNWTNLANIIPQPSSNHAWGLELMIKSNRVVCSWPNPLG